MLGLQAVRKKSMSVLLVPMAEMLDPVMPTDRACFEIHKEGVHRQNGVAFYRSCFATMTS